ncbi:MAG: signal peptidase II [Mollicutes bacterium]|nr:signal peptidase II [Mollicutes bacterium]
MYKKIGLISLICLFVDQLTKFIVISKMSLFSSIEVIKSFFSITYVRNYGAAWSILEGSNIFLILFALSSLFLIYWLFIKNHKLSKLDIITYGMLIGGIIGNLIDRIIYGYVIDFLDFNIFKYDYPVFNMADVFIVVAVGLIIFSILRGKDAA